MIYGSVCSGIEAATVAWHPLGWRPAFFSEIEPFPRAVLAHHYPDVPCHGDFTTIEGKEYGPIDVLVGGTPCQDFSIAGLRLGLAGERGNLTLEFLRVAARTKPRWIVWENVPGVLSLDGGRAFGAVLGALGQLGYGFAYRVLDAQYFELAQRRARVFVIGCLGDWRRAAAVLFEPESLHWHPAPSRQAGERVARPIASSAPDSSGYRNDADTAENLIPLGLGDNGELARALNGCNTASGRMDVSVDTFVAHPLRADGFDASEDGTGRGVPLVPVWSQEIADPIAANQARTYTIVAFSLQQIAGRDNRSNPQPADPAPTLAGDRAPGLATQWAVRRLTPRECERLQGFPDDYTLVPYRKKPAMDGPRYKALGNSMAVPVMHWIGRRIAMMEAA